MKRWISWILAAVLTLGLLTGCGRQSPYEPTGNGLGEEGAMPPLEDSEQAVQNLALVYHPENTMNPYTCADYTNRALFSLVYQGLFTVDSAYRVSPVLCRSFWVSQDHRTYIFYPENAYFSDGIMLTAADVAASLEAARQSPVYSGRLYNVMSITLTADGGVQLELKTPYENLPLLLDIPIVRQSQVSAAFPVGTGPYALEQGLSGRWLRLRRDWWCDARLPIAAEQISLLTAASTKEIRDQFELGTVGVVCANPGADSYVDFRSDHRLWDCESGIFLYLGCRAKSSVFNNVAVRQALTYAIDRWALSETYYRTFAQPATLPASPDSPWYNQALAEKYRYDADVFRQTLQAEGLEGKSIVLLVNKDDGRRTKAAQGIADMLEACGLKVTVRAYGGADYTKALKNGNYDLHLGQTMLSPNMDLSAFFSTDGSLSYGGMSDSAVYELCQDALASSGNYTALHQAVMEDAMLCPVAFIDYAIYVQPELTGDLEPARDCLFYYDLGKTISQIKTQE